MCTINPLVVENGVYSRVVRDTKYVISTKTNEFMIGERTLSPNENPKEFAFVWAIMNDDKFVLFLENALKLKVNEDKVGVDILKEKHGKGYRAIKKEVSDTFNDYFIGVLSAQNRFAKTYLKSYFESEDFSVLLKALQNELRILLKARTFDTIPYVIDNSPCMKAILEKDCILGNCQISCEELKKITNIKWCKEHCEKFSSCDVWKEMKEKDPFNWGINQDFLNT